MFKSGLIFLLLIPLPNRVTTFIEFTFVCARRNNSAFKDVIIDLIAGSIGATGRKISKTIIFTFGQAGFEAAFQVPMPGDSGSSPDAGSISNYCLTQEIYHSNPSGLLSFNKSETVLWTIAKIKKIKF